MKLELKKTVRNLAALTAVIFCAAVGFAQEAEDGFKVPLNENFSKAQNSSSAPVKAGPSAKSPLKQGLWIETYGDATSLIRNISDGEKKGYELDKVEFSGEANWWFWGDIKDMFHLDAEIGVCNFIKTLYQANSYGANVPDVTWGDGLQSVAEIPFSFFKHTAGDKGVGAFNKMSFNIETPFVDLRMGYGNLKANGMTEFTGIYSVIDRWDDVGDGYTELKNGWALRNFGNFSVDALLALSEMKEKYGSYDYLDVKYSDKAEAAFTFASLSPEEDLFFYNRTNKNAFSVYGAVTPFARLKLEGHYMGCFGSDVDLNGASSAGAGRIKWTGDTWTASLKQSVAGVNVDSVWGCDGQSYDDINKDTATTQLDLWKDFGKLAAGLDQGITFNDTDNLSEGLVHLRSEPYADINLSSLLGKQVSAGVYTVLGFDRLSKETNKDQKTAFKLEEAGIEVKTGRLAEKLQRLTFDYAVSVEYNDTTTGYDRNVTYHSIIADGQITENFNLHAGTIVRDVKNEDPANIPVGFAAGTSFANLPLAGHPKLWIHFTYGMGPYEDNNYSFYRKDDPRNNSIHRTYLLNKLEGITTSRVAVGMIWNL